MPGERAMDIDTQQALGLDPGKGALGILDIGEDREAALIIGFAIERRAHLARGALEQADAETFFDQLDGVRDGGARQAQILGRSLGSGDADVNLLTADQALSTLER